MCQSVLLLPLFAFSNLAGQLDRKDFNVEMSLLRLANLQKETFSVGLRVLCQLASLKLSQNQEATGANCP